MELSPFEWMAIGILGTLGLSIIAFFVKGLFKKQEKHEEITTDIRLTFASKDEVKGHERDINHIKQTYVSKDDLREFKAEIRGETQKLGADVEEIKKNYLTKADYLHHQRRTEDKMDLMYKILLELKGG